MPSHPDPRLTYARFLVGPHNRAAAEACRRWAAGDVGAARVLLVRGAAGSGKTHLLHATAREAMQAAGGEVCLVTPATLPDALGKHADDRPLRLILDDAEGLDEDLRSILIEQWKRLMANGGGFVLSLAPGAAPLHHLGVELRNRIAEGLEVEIGPPGVDLRRKLIAGRLQELGETLDEEAFEAMVRIPHPGVRGLFDALDRLLAATREHGQVPAGEVAAFVAPAAEARGAEFDDFLSDISVAVAGMVSAAPAEPDDVGSGGGWVGPSAGTRTLADFAALRHADSVGARAAREILASPGTGYNPVFVAGSEGIGKTTLLAGIGNAFLNRYPDCWVGFVPAPDETDWDALADVDLLMIDDFHEVADRETGIADVVARFVSDHRQVVVASRRRLEEMVLPPAMERLFRDGLVLALADDEAEREVAAQREARRRRALDYIATTEIAGWAALDERLLEEPA